MSLIDEGGIPKRKRRIRGFSRSLDREKERELEARRNQDRVLELFARVIDGATLGFNKYAARLKEEKIPERRRNRIEEKRRERK